MDGLICVVPWESGNKNGCSMYLRMLRRSVCFIGSRTGEIRSQRCSALWNSEYAVHCEALRMQCIVKLCVCSAGDGWSSVVFSSNLSESYPPTHELIDSSTRQPTTDVLQCVIAVLSVCQQCTRRTPNPRRPVPNPRRPVPNPRRPAPNSHRPALNCHHPALRHIYFWVRLPPCNIASPSHVVTMKHRNWNVRTSKWVAQHGMHVICYFHRNEWVRLQSQVCAVVRFATVTSSRLISLAISSALHRMVYIPPLVSVVLRSTQEHINTMYAVCARWYLALTAIYWYTWTTCR